MYVQRRVSNAWVILGEGGYLAHASSALSALAQVRLWACLRDFRASLSVLLHDSYATEGSQGHSTPLPPRHARHHDGEG